MSGGDLDGGKGGLGPGLSGGFAEGAVLAVGVVGLAEVGLAEVGSGLVSRLRGLTSSMNLLAPFLGGVVCSISSILASEGSLRSLKGIKKGKESGSLTVDSNSSIVNRASPV